MWLDPRLALLTRHGTISVLACGNGSTLPFADNSFDLVTANMVLEHLADPSAQFLEIRRVLDSQGVFLCHTPNVLGYTTMFARLLPEFLKKRLIALVQRRKAADVFKTYYHANSRRRLRRIAKESGLGVIDLSMTLSSAELALVTPIAALELLWIRALMSPRLEALRPSIIGAFRKSELVTDGTASQSSAQPAQGAHD